MDAPLLMSRRQAADAAGSADRGVVSGRSRAGGERYMAGSTRVRRRSERGTAGARRWSRGLSLDHGVARIRRWAPGSVLMRSSTKILCEINNVSTAQSLRLVVDWLGAVCFDDPLHGGEVDEADLRRLAHQLAGRVLHLRATSAGSAPGIPARGGAARAGARCRPGLAAARNSVVPAASLPTGAALRPPRRPRDRGSYPQFQRMRHRHLSASTRTSLCSQVNRSTCRIRATGSESCHRAGSAAR